MNINNHQLTQSISQKFHESQQRVNIPPTKEKQKTVFFSKVDRFTNLNKLTPGPGTYHYDSKHMEKHSFHENKDKDDKFGISKQHQWILGSQRFSIGLSNGSDRNLGPGLYNQSTLIADNSHSNWAKKERFTCPKNLKVQLGPGSYDNAKTSKKQQKTLLSVFKSRSPKTFFQEMIQKQKKSQKKLNPEQNEDQYQQSQSIVKFDQTQYSIRHKVQKPNSIFLSKSKRPQLINQHSIEKIGPGSYSLQSPQYYHNVKQKGLTSAIHYNIKSIEEISKEILPKVNSPGPGSYNIEKLAMSQILMKKSPLGYLAKQERFRLNTNKSNEKLPGPGEYNQNRFTMIKQEDIRLKNKVSFNRRSQKSHDFGLAARTTLRNQNQVPFGQYNVCQFDLEYKLMKQKEQYQKLRLMEVTLPAFNTKNYT